MYIFTNLISSYYVSILFIFSLVLGIHINYLQDTRLLPFMIFLSINWLPVQEIITGLKHMQCWSRSMHITSLFCVQWYVIGSLKSTIVWLVFTPQTVANARNQNLFPLGNWLLKISFYTLPITEIHRNLFPHFRCIQSACEIRGSTFTDKWVYIYLCTLYGDKSKVRCCKEQNCIGI